MIILKITIFFRFLYRLNVKYWQEKIHSVKTNVFLNNTILNQSCSSYLNNTSIVNSQR